MYVRGTGDKITDRCTTPTTSAMEVGSRLFSCLRGEPEQAPHLRVCVLHEVVAVRLQDVIFRMIY